MYKCCLIIGMTQAFLKPLSWNESQSIGKSLKKERNWCLNHVNILSDSKVMTKNRHQNMYICIFFGPIYQNGHQIVTTSSLLLALKTGISYPPPFLNTWEFFFYLILFSCNFTGISCFLLVIQFYVNPSVYQS